MSTIVAVNGVIETNDKWPEGTAVGYDVSFQDEDGAAYTPASTIAAKVYPKSGAVIETLTAITAAATIEVTTAEATNNIGTSGQQRILSLEWTAITTRYSAPGITQRCDIHYQISDMRDV